MTQIIRHCETCRFWDQNDLRNLRNTTFVGGVCQSKGLRELWDEYEDEVPPDALRYPYLEYGHFWTGPKFGCVHHTPKEENDQPTQPDTTQEQWQPVETMPRSGKFLIGVWEGEWRHPRKDFCVYEATGFESGPVWAQSYRTAEGGTYEVVGWMPKSDPPAWSKGEQQ